MSDTAVLPSSPPAAQGVDAEGVGRFLDAVDAHPGIELHSLVLLRHGHRVAAGWAWPYTDDRVQLVYSLSKSFTAAAAALAVAEGLVRLDDPVLDYFPELDSEITDARSRAMLVRHVLTMASGHESETLERASELDPHDLVRGFLLLPPERDPGSVFAYNQPATYALAAVVQRVTGEALTDYLRPRLLDPLGIGEALWRPDASGRQVGYSELHVTTDAVARLGQLHLQGGAWQGRQVLPRDWVVEGRRSHVDTAGEPNPDWQQGYGYQLWMSRHGFRGDGACGQLCLVLPEQDAVVAITAATHQMQDLLQAVWDCLLPAMRSDALPETRADAALAARLTALTLPMVSRLPAPPSDEAWPGTSFAPTGGRSDEQASLTALDVRAERDGWSVTLQEGESALDVRLGTDSWAVSEPTASDGARVPVAVSGGWTGEDTLGLDVVFLETPHRLALTCSLARGEFEAAWQTAPLRPLPLTELRAPRPGD